MATAAEDRQRAWMPIEHVEDGFRADGHITRNVFSALFHEEFGGEILNGLQMVQCIVDHDRRGAIVAVAPVRCEQSN